MTQPFASEPVTRPRNPELLAMIGGGLGLIGAVITGLAQQRLLHNHYAGFGTLSQLGGACTLIAGLLLALWLVTKLTRGRLLPAKSEGAKVMLIGLAVVVAAIVLLVVASAVASGAASSARMAGYGFMLGVDGVIRSAGLLLVGLGWVALLVVPAAPVPSANPGGWPQYGSQYPNSQYGNAQYGVPDPGNPYQGQAGPGSDSEPPRGW